MRPLGNAHRTVPYNGARADEGLCKQLLSLFADVKPHPTVGDGVGVNAHIGGVFVILATDDVINGEQEVDLALACLVDHLACEVELVVLADGGTDRLALCLEEGVCHTAADDEGVALFDEVVDNADLVGDLGAAEDGDEGTGGILKSLAHNGDFLLDQVAADSGKSAVHRNAGSGGVCAVSCAEGVVYEDLSHRSEFFCKFGVVLLLAGIKTGVLKQQSFAGLEVGSHFACLGTDGIGGERYFLTEQLGKSCRNGSQCVLGVDLSLGLAHVRAKDHGCTVREQILDGGDSFDDPLVGGDDAVLERDVEVAAYKNLFAGYVDILNGFFIVGH